MTPRINLLPVAYLETKRQTRRCRRGVLVIASLLIGELITGLYVHQRAEETRSDLAAAEAARFAVQEMKSQLLKPKQELEVLEQQVQLAEHLRVTHHWSRLLATLAEQVPDRVVLTSVKTDPARWTRSIYKEEVDKTEVSRRQAIDKGKDQPPPLRSMLAGLNIRGYAVDYRDLSAMTASLNDCGAFHTVDLKEARRGQYRGRDVVQFELDCRW
jgi:Tfp pilus assembly protein PilN